MGRPPTAEVRIGDRVASLGPRATRLVGAVVVLAGVGIVLFVFLVNAEPPGGAPGGHWGSTWIQVVVAIWLLLLLGLTVLNLTKTRK
jgi:hypothetical protein